MIRTYEELKSMFEKNNLPLPKKFDITLLNNFIDFNVDNPLKFDYQIKNNTTTFKTFEQSQKWLSSRPIISINVYVIMDKNAYGYLFNENTTDQEVIDFVSNVYNQTNNITLRDLRIRVIPKYVKIYRPNDVQPWDVEPYNNDFLQFFNFGAQDPNVFDLQEANLVHLCGYGNAAGKPLYYRNKDKSKLLYDEEFELHQYTFMSSLDPITLGHELGHAFGAYHEGDFDIGKGPYGRAYEQPMAMGYDHKIVSINRPHGGVWGLTKNGIEPLDDSQEALDLLKYQLKVADNTAGIFQTPCAFPGDRNEGNIILRENWYISDRFKPWKWKGEYVVRLSQIEEMNEEIEKLDELKGLPCDRYDHSMDVKYSTKRFLYEDDELQHCTYYNWITYWKYEHSLKSAQTNKGYIGIGDDNGGYNRDIDWGWAEIFSPQYLNSFGQQYRQMHSINGSPLTSYAPVRFDGYGNYEIFWNRICFERMVYQSGLEDDLYEDTFFDESHFTNPGEKPLFDLSEHSLIGVLNSEKTECIIYANTYAYSMLNRHFTLGKLKFNVLLDNNNIESWSLNTQLFKYEHTTFENNTFTIKRPGYIKIVPNNTIYTTPINWVTYKKICNLWETDNTIIENANTQDNPWMFKSRKLPLIKIKFTNSVSQTNNFGLHLNYMKTLGLNYDEEGIQEPVIVNKNGTILLEEYDENLVEYSNFTNIYENSMKKDIHGLSLPVINGGEYLDIFSNVTPEFNFNRPVLTDGSNFGENNLFKALGTKSKTIEPYKASPDLITPTGWNSISPQQLESSTFDLSNLDFNKFKDVSDNTPEGIHYSSDDIVELSKRKALLENGDMKNGRLNTSRAVVLSNRQLPLITLNGSDQITIEVFGQYSEPGYSAYDQFDGDLSSNVIISGNLNTNIVNTYTIKYDVLDSSNNAAVTAVRVINVVDSTPPTISLVGNNVINLNVFTPYVEYGAIAEDNYDGNLTNNILINGIVDTNTVGIYELVYSIEDSSLNSASVKRTIHVVDTIAPTLTLLGNSEESIEVFGEYIEKGCIAIDNYNGDISSNIVINHAINTQVLGKYIVQYDVSDSSGNSAQTLYRTVNVVDTTSPVITITGQLSKRLEVGYNYFEQGATAYDNYDGDITSNINISNNIDITKVGEYQVVYNVKDSSGNEANVYRTIYIIDSTPPVLTLNGSESLVLLVNRPYIENGATAYDNYDGDISDKIQQTGTVETGRLGTYLIHYSISDSSGNTTTKTRSVEIIDNVPPTIALNGKSFVRIKQHDIYQEQGAVAYDNFDKDISNMIKITGVVDTTNPGTYTIIYEVSDSSGNTSTIERNIKVVTSTLTIKNGVLTIHNGTLAI